METRSAFSIDQPYEYEDLNLERPALRLARLFSGDGPDLNCELFQAYLDDRETVLPYEAISYTWGLTDLSHSIDIDGKKLGITASLYVALKQLRYTDSDRILWVDGICINQGNHKERGHQVQQMGYIYRHAERVVFWLGVATNETDELMESLQRLTKDSMQYATAAWTLQDPQWEYMWETSQLASQRFNCNLTEVLRRGLKDILERPWFARAWILQEVANAQSALMCCGQMSVSARLFPLMPVVLGVKPEKLQQAVLDIMPGPSRKSTWWAQNRSMYYLLRYFGSSQATEPRDIIYALRGISTDANDPEILTPDYRLSDQELVQKVTRFLFHCDIGELTCFDPACHTRSCRTVVHDIRDLAERLSDINNAAIGECIRTSNTKPLWTLLDRGDTHISEHTVRCALSNKTGLWLLRSVLGHGQRSLVVSDEAVFLLARQGDAKTVDIAVRQWNTTDNGLKHKFLTLVNQNESHRDQIYALGHYPELRGTINGRYHAYSYWDLSTEVAYDDQASPEMDESWDSD